MTDFSIKRSFEHLSFLPSYFAMSYMIFRLLNDATQASQKVGF